ncbi:hypothetical protein C8Q76DRAFT_340473 [Earliella scabrosa]|nr:hypothetical protein C8Q76DRAFT_340473 [Earliella scabrosa]
MSVNPWEAGIEYNADSVVEYEGHRYKIVQPHQSQSGWEPSSTSTLWERLPDNSDDNSNQKKSGLLSGLAGIFSFGKNNDEPELTYEQWLQDAEQRTRDYYDGKTEGPVTWILVDGKNVPTNIAIPGGEERGTPHYICRGFHAGSLQIGKASPIFPKGGVIGYGHREIQLDKYEVLVGDKRAIRWVSCEGRLEVEKLPGRPVEGGREANGKPLFIAQAYWNRAVVPGKCGPSLPKAFIPYANDEKEERHYRVLCYA